MGGIKWIKKTINKYHKIKDILIAILIMSGLGLLFGSIYWGIQREEAEYDIIRQNKGIAEAVIYKVKYLKKKNYSASIIFYVGNKRYVPYSIPFDKMPPLGLRVPVWYNPDDPKMNMRAEDARMDSILQDPVKFYERQVREDSLEWKLILPID